MPLEIIFCLRLIKALDANNRSEYMYVTIRTVEAVMHTFLFRARQIVFLVLISSIAFAQTPPQPVDRLVQAAPVWGLAKYFHPRVTNCQTNWDQSLLDALPAIQNSQTDVQFDSAISALLDRAGAAPIRAPDGSTPSWISASGLSPQVQARLAGIAANQPSKQCYVGLRGTGQADMSKDVAFASDLPIGTLRLLGVFRFWNAIEYFSPYKPEIGAPWDSVLRAHLPALMNAKDDFDYVLAMRAFTAEIKDTHAYLSGGGFSIGGPLPPFKTKTVEGRLVISRLAGGASARMQVGDELLSIDGRTVAQLLEEIAPYLHGSNPVAKTYRTDSVLTAVGSRVAEFTFLGSDGKPYSEALKLDYLNNQTLQAEVTPMFRTQTLPGGCSMGIVNMALLTPSTVDSMFAALKSTDAIIFDGRNYPNTTMWPIIDRIYTSPRTAMRISGPNLKQPGTFTTRDERLGGTRYNGYRGRLLSLFDENTISQAEFTQLGFAAYNNTVTFGSQTQGADGDLVGVKLGGGMSVNFSGLGIYYPDGRATQRIGIVPDLHVVPTIADVRAGRDTVLEAALDCRWITQRPPARRPAPGMYWQPSRNGEGIDMFQSGALSIALVYSYDADGNSVWATSSSTLSAGVWDAPTLHYTAGQATPQTGEKLMLDFQRGPYTPACAIADQSKFANRATIAWPLGSTNVGCIEALIVDDKSGGAAGATLSGLWSGPTSDLGWGVSVHQAFGQLWTILYAYDELGKPRWLIGNAALQASGDYTINMSRVRGFCPTCTPTAISTTAAGTVKLHFPPLGAPATEIATATIDVQPTASSRWQRQETPITRITDH